MNGVQTGFQISFCTPTCSLFVPFPSVGIHLSAFLNVTHNVQHGPQPFALVVSGDIELRDINGPGITAAEYFIDTIGAYGTGSFMNPTDGSFNSAREDVYADIYIGDWINCSSHKVYVHGMDSSGNWGPFESIVVMVGDTDENP